MLCLQQPPEGLAVARWKNQGDIGEQLLSTQSPKGLAQVRGCAACLCLLHRLQELVFQTKVSSQMVHRHLFSNCSHHWSLEIYGYPCFDQSSYEF